MAKSSKMVDCEVQMDRRRNERRTEQNASESMVDGGLVPRKKQRRRQIDPTTCERDYNGEEIQFMHALDDYKRSSGRMFPTCSEILEVIRSLGYVKLTPEELTLLEVQNLAIKGDDQSSESLEECSQFA
jgi:hypothetical protein